MDRQVSDLVDGQRQLLKNVEAAICKHVTFEPNPDDPLQYVAALNMRLVIDLRQMSMASGEILARELFYNALISGGT